MPPNTVIDLPLYFAHFDPHNPRFPKSVNEGPEDKLVERMIKEERILELMESIGEQGYFPGEPLIAVKHGEDRFFIAEGNRRLAALKLLNGSLPIPPKLSTLIDAKADAKFKPDWFPVLFLMMLTKFFVDPGFRHITGVKLGSPSPRPVI